MKNFREREEKKAKHQRGFEPKTFRSQGTRFTAVLQPLPPFPFHQLVSKPKKSRLSYRSTPLSPSRSSQPSVQGRPSWPNVRARASGKPRCGLSTRSGWTSRWSWRPPPPSRTRRGRTRPSRAEPSRRHRPSIEVDPSPLAIWKSNRAFENTKLKRAVTRVLSQTCAELNPQLLSRKIPGGTWMKMKMGGLVIEAVARLYRMLTQGVPFISSWECWQAKPRFPGVGGFQLGAKLR